MRYEIEKLEKIKKLINNIIANERRINKISERQSNETLTYKQSEKINLDRTYLAHDNDKICVLMQGMITSLGIMDVTADVFRDGWTERRK